MIENMSTGLAIFLLACFIIGVGGLTVLAGKVIGGLIDARLSTKEELKESFDEWVEANSNTVKNEERE